MGRYRNGWRGWGEIEKRRGLVRAWVFFFGLLALVFLFILLLSEGFTFRVFFLDYRIRCSSSVQVRQIFLQI